jgi:hypothetical protein
LVSLLSVDALNKEDSMQRLRHLILLLALISPLQVQAQAENAGAARGDAGATDTNAQRSANRFVVGVLVDARTVRVDGGEAFHRLIKLENREGQELIVDLGASPPPEAIGLREGDLVVALGKSARINGHPVLYALYVAPLTELSRVREDQASRR